MAPAPVLRGTLEVRGWWPRWRFNPLSGGFAQITVDGHTTATIDGLRRRRRRMQLPAGTHTVSVSDFSGRRPRVVLHRSVTVEPGGLVVIQFRGAYRRRLAGTRLEAECWMAEGQPRTTWFAPRRPRHDDHRRRASTAGASPRFLISVDLRKLGPADRRAVWRRVVELAVANGAGSFTADLQGVSRRMVNPHPIPDRWESLVDYGPDSLAMNLWADGEYTAGICDRGKCVDAVFERGVLEQLEGTLVTLDAVPPFDVAEVEGRGPTLAASSGRVEARLPFVARGEILRNLLVRWLPVDRLVASSDRLRLCSVVFDPVEVDRTNLELVVIRRVRLPFVWTTYLVFVLRSDAVRPSAFVPIRWRRTVRALDELGWPVVDGPPVGWRGLRHISGR